MKHPIASARTMFGRALLPALILAATLAALPAAASPPSADEVAERLQKASSRGGSWIEVSELAKDADGNAISVAQVGNGDARQPAFLLVAGLDGRHGIGTELALRHLEAMAADVDSSRQALGAATLYVIPTLTPGSTNALRGRPSRARSTAPGSGDHDDDGLTGEDLADDMDGDGVIRWVRVRDEAGPYRTDPTRPELLAPVNRAEGESGQWRLLVEGRDDDGDDTWNEEEDGGVLLSSNFPFEYEWFGRNRGFHQVSETETRALADFLVAHPEIAVVLVYGFEDNLLQPWPEGKSSNPSLTGSRWGRRPVTLPNEHDLPLARDFSRRYQEFLGFDKPKNNLAYGDFLLDVVPEEGRPIPTAADAAKGGFGSFAYFHRGRMALMTPCWTPRLQLAWNELDEAEAKKAAAEAEKAAAGDGGEDTESGGRSAPDPLGEATPEAGTDAAMKTAASATGAGTGNPGGDAEEDAEPELPEPIRNYAKFHDWLIEQAPDSWKDWQSVAHPDFPDREAEVGGYAPLAWVYPPDNVIDRLAEAHHRFLLEVMDSRAEVRLRAASLKSLGAEVFELEFEVENVGYLPDVLGQGVYSTLVRPTRFELDLPTGGTVLGGSERQAVSRLPGGGEMVHVKRVLRLPQTGPVRINIISELGGHDDRRIAVGESWRRP